MESGGLTVQVPQEPNLACLAKESATELASLFTKPQSNLSNHVEYIKIFARIKTL